MMQEELEEIVQQEQCHALQWLTHTFKNSHSGNCIAENGICILIQGIWQHLMFSRLMHMPCSSLTITSLSTVHPSCTYSTVCQSNLHNGTQCYCQMSDHQLSLHTPLSRLLSHTLCRDHKAPACSGWWKVKWGTHTHIYTFPHAEIYFWLRLGLTWQSCALRQHVYLWCILHGRWVTMATVIPYYH